MSRNRIIEFSNLQLTEENVFGAVDDPLELEDMLDMLCTADITFYSQTDKTESIFVPEVPIAWFFSAIFTSLCEVIFFKQDSEALIPETDGDLLISPESEGKISISLRLGHRKILLQKNTDSFFEEYSDLVISLHNDLIEACPKLQDLREFMEYFFLTSRMNRKHRKKD